MRPEDEGEQGRQRVGLVGGVGLLRVKQTHSKVGVFSLTPRRSVLDQAFTKRVSQCSKRNCMQSEGPGHRQAGSRGVHVVVHLYN